MGERWKNIPEYPNYDVSDKGCVRNNTRGHFLKPNIVKGYYRVVLCNGGTCRPKSVHRLVAEMFLENDSRDRNEVNHIDGNKLNNNVDNLEWVTTSENAIHAYVHGLRTAPQPNAKRVRIVETDEVFESASSCARHIGGRKSHVCECVRGERMTHKGYHFEIVPD